MSEVYILRNKNFLSLRREFVRVLGKFNFAERGERIVLKPNVSSPLPSSTGATTDVRVVEIVARYLKRMGVEPVIMEAPIQIYDFEETMGITGFRKMCEDLGIDLINPEEDKKVRVSIGDEDIHLPETLLDADGIVNIPKLKTHTLTGVSLGMKNLKGFLTREGRRRFHSKNIHLLIALLNEKLLHKIRLSVMEGIVGMEGPGPTHGRPVKGDLLIVGDNNISVDMVACKILGVDFHSVEQISYAMERNLPGSDFEKIRIFGEMPLLKFEIPLRRRSLLSNWVMKSRMISWSLRRLNIPLKIRDKPVISEGKCSRCLRCVKICAANAITPPRIDYRKCVGCMQCLEVCPNSAIEIEGRGHKLLRILTG